MDKETFDSICSDIETSYAELGHTLGWRFLMGPQATLSDKTKLALITLNPGGHVEPPDHPRKSVENGNAYFVEQWRNTPAGQDPLQVQVQALMAEFQERLNNGYSVRQFADTSILCAYFIPFRSPRFQDLPRKHETLAFAKKLWRQILSILSLNCIITIDRETFSAMEELVILRNGNFERKAFESGWGNYCFEASRCYAADGRTVTVARFPHLSTFKVFSRSACRPHIQTFLDYVTAT
ncbi:hypothetical protein [Solidesulfovibrio alcoholivorans]|uniref:hypothetical protein n=1 Tax=Solidesulfovibrio alcoholivorans TaxID=81406 RepID=UPI0012EC6B4E|nr:hypothetical protein [Solidesulfovibrio alcoholivorans]